jgi:hypothetical protein
MQKSLPLMFYQSAGSFCLKPNFLSRNPQRRPVLKTVDPDVFPWNRSQIDKIDPVAAEKLYRIITV